MGLRKKKSLVDQAGDYVEAMKPRVESALETAGGFVRDTALPALNDARDKAGPALAEARDKAAPVIADAKVRAAVGLAEAREKAAPLVAQGAAIAAERVTAARELADAKTAELTGAPEPQKKSKLKRFVLVAGVAGAAAAVAKKLRGGSSSGDNWQSTYTPAPAPAAPVPPTPSAPQAGLEDSAGASPDEALSDAAEAPHPVTTPDDPAEVVDVEPGSK
ncbi:MAG: hypothetical protein WB767_18405 [Nocardioides sp.]